jgi:hypothetical protein
MHSRGYVKFLATYNSRGPLNAKRNLQYATKETVKSSSLSWRVTVAPIARGFPRGPGLEGCGPKICKFTCISRRAIPHPAWLLDCPVYPLAPRRDPWEPVVLPLSLFLFSGIITIRDHKWNLSRLSRVTIGQSPRARHKDVARIPACTYICTLS